MKIALGAHVDSFNVNVKELEKSSDEYFWYSVLTESQFTLYSQMEGHLPVCKYMDPTEGIQKYWKLHSNVRHAIARFPHSKWNNEGRSTDTDGAYLLIWR
eukprot:5646374-Amphidinium_carterae.1